MNTDLTRKPSVGLLSAEPRCALLRGKEQKPSKATDFHRELFMITYAVRRRPSPSCGGC